MRMSGRRVTWHVTAVVSTIIGAAAPRGLAQDAQPIGPLTPVNPAGPVTPIDPIAVCTRYYVHPSDGSDADPGTLAQPFRTLSHAMQVAVTPSVIMLLPGRYGPSTNGEFWPVYPRDHVSVQGTSVLDTVLLGEGQNVFWFFAISPQAFGTVQYDGFSITGASTAIRIFDELYACRPTLSNLALFDNGIGIEMVAIDLGPDASPDDSDNNGYVEERPRIVNCTIVQNDIGILDWQYGMWPSYGEAEPCVLNCIVLGNTLSDLEGVDDTDLDHTMFCTSDQAGISTIRPSKPAPVSLPGGCGSALTDIFINPATGDFRQRPFAVTIDRGRIDSPGTHIGDPIATPIRLNFPCGQMLFDVDGEGYGNPRVEGSAIDLGADEHGMLIVSGFIPLTRSFGTDPVTAVIYDTVETWLTPEPAIPAPFSAIFILGVPSSTSWIGWSPPAVPGVRPQGTTAPTPYGTRGDLYIDPGTTVPLFTLAMPAPGTPLLRVLPVLPAGPVRNNLQLLPRDANGVLHFLTNLQTYLVTP